MTGCPRNYCRPLKRHDVIVLRQSRQASYRSSGRLSHPSIGKSLMISWRISSAGVPVPVSQAKISRMTGPVKRVISRSRRRVICLYPPCTSQNSSAGPSWLRPEYRQAVQRLGDRLLFSPSDLNHFPECDYLTTLDLAGDPGTPRGARYLQAELLATKVP